MRLYFNGAVNSNWNTLGNWWQDSGFTTPAAALPANGDDVEIYAEVATPPSSPVTLVSIYVDGLSSAFNVDLTGTIGDAIFFGDVTNVGAITGSATWSDGVGAAGNNGTVTGDAVFNVGSASNGGTVLGDAVFYSGTDNYGPVNGQCNMSSSGGNNYSTVGSLLLSFGGVNYGTVTGNADFYDGSANDVSGIVLGHAEFWSVSYNFGTLPDAGFGDTATNQGTVTSAYFGDFAVNDGTVTTGTFDQDSVNNSTVTTGNFMANATNAGSVTTGTFIDYALNNADVVNGSFYNNASNNLGTVSGTARFYGSSTNSPDGSGVYGDAYFYESAVNYGPVNGDALYSPSAIIAQVLAGSAGPVYGSIRIPSADILGTGLA